MLSAEKRAAIGAAALAIREFLAHVEVLDDDGRGGRVCREWGDSLETLWARVCESVNAASQRLLADLPIRPNGFRDLSDFTDAERVVFAQLRHTLWKSAITRYTPEGKPWLREVANSAHVPPIGVRVVKANGLRKLRAVVTQMEKLAGATGKRKPRKRKRPILRKEPILTPLEVNTMRVVSRHQGNIAAAAAELDRDPKTVRENYARALNKSSRIAGHKSRSVRTHRLPEDHRGQASVSRREG